MKSTYYDVLQVSPKATFEVIDAAYARLKASFSSTSGSEHEDARNQLLFLEEAYAVLSSTQRRADYDRKIQPEPGRGVANSERHAEFNVQERWRDTFGGRIFLAAVFFASVFAVYKFTGQRGVHDVAAEQVKTQSTKEVGAVRNDAYRAETERTLVQGVVSNQEKQIDASRDIAVREAERRRVELEYRASAGSQQLDLQRQRLEAQMQEQRWRQEQHEKDQQAREARAAAEAPKKQLCNMYALNGNTRDAQAAGCYRY